MKTTLNNVLFGFLGLLMVVFGLNKFLGFIPVEPPADETAQQFLGTMFTSYLFVVVAIGEIAGGILLAMRKTRLLGWLLLAPIVFNIVAFHVAHDFVGNGIWLLPTALFLVGGFFLKGETFELLKTN
ncbi:DoxX family membrane protein [Flagellimonas allohymeniacidonis]|uniref:DoxX family membrane protein n=1 Tax=Flagellimonas allohymeniacidonis TaxID=2517819 RepID=A0A4Q8QFF1_9FLAO|nr:DoxX family membrane protein [Allomuricauda hymeniacidonis]TAI47938.1 DoxX family membrane protein [Allomuricauda hymeniacidonis]